jgi:hypothetical protein
LTALPTTDSIESSHPICAAPMSFSRFTGRLQVEQTNLERMRQLYQIIDLISIVY